MNTLPGPRLSIVVIAYNMARELPRTLQTLSANYQRGIDPHDYEVLILDNGSTPAVDQHSFDHLQAWPDQFRLFRLENASPSPVNAINYGLQQAKGSYIGVMIDGARMCSPGLLGQALQACTGIPNAVVGTLGWYLGPDFQRQAIMRGYDQQREDALLASIDWVNDGYSLYSVSCMDESSIDGWYAPVTEFNAIFMHKLLWEDLGGFDPNFNMPGGGLANLDVCKRALELPNTQGVILRGEATFHQVHGGTATNTPLKKAISDWDNWCAHYESLRGHPYQPPQPSKPLVHFGHLPDQVRLHYLRALVFAPKAIEKSCFPLGENFDLATWAMPVELWEPQEAKGCPDVLAQQAIAYLLRSALQEKSFIDLVIACRWICMHFPLWKPPAVLLSLLSPWFSHSENIEETSLLLSSVKSVINGVPYYGKSKLPSIEKNNSEFNVIDNSYVPESLVHPAVFLEPIHFLHPAPWAGHIPFVAWLLVHQSPRTLVELGTFSGISYLAMCQVIKQHSLPTHAWAVDTWEGDAHTGPYDGTMYKNLRKAHDSYYQNFSNLLRMKFDDALPLFKNNSIDLLHIDGLHTYEAVKHDFETWLPKLSDRAVVLFHDTNVYHSDFGVYRLWDELSSQYPSLHFNHSNGLGVLLVGKEQPKILTELCEVKNTVLQYQAQKFFSFLGERLERREEAMRLEIQLNDAEYRVQHERDAGRQRHEWIEKQDDVILDLTRQLNSVNCKLDEVYKLHSSRFVKFAFFMQKLINKFKKSIIRRD